MKRLFAILLVFAVLASFSSVGAVDTERGYEFIAEINNDSSENDPIDYDYIESVGTLRSRFGTGCKPLIIESWEEYDRVFLCPCENCTDDHDCNCDNPLDKSAIDCNCELNRDEDFYEDYVTALIFSWAPTLGYNYTVDGIDKNENGVPLISYTCIQPSGECPTEVQETLIAVSFKRADFEDYRDVKFIPTMTYSHTIDFEYDVIDVNYSEEFYANHSWQDLILGRAEPIVINDKSELEALSGNFASGFDTFVENLENDYFENGALVLHYAPAPSSPRDYTVDFVTVFYSELHIYYSYYDGACDAIQESLIIVYVDKENVENVEYTSAVPSVKGQRRGDIDGNGFIEQYDYIYAKRAHFGTLDLSEEQKFIADVNLDGEVNQYDYILIKRHYFKTYRING